MRFLVDEPLPPALCRWLVARGYEADHVVRLKLQGRPDSEVRARALRDGAVIITKDDDYIGLIDRFGSVQIVWVRIGNVANRALFSRLEEVWPDIESALAAGDRVVQLLSGDPPS